MSDLNKDLENTEAAENEAEKETEAVAPEENEIKEPTAETEPENNEEAEAESEEAPVSLEPEASEEQKPEKQPAKRPARRRTTVGSLSDIARDTFETDLAAGRIISIDGQLQADTEARRVLHTVQQLAGSYRNREPLPATLTEILFRKDKDPAPVATFGEFRILLQAKDFLNMRAFDGMDPDTRFSQIRSRLQKRIGSEIEFLLERTVDPSQSPIDQDNRLAVGSRRSALMVRRQQYWMPGRDGRTVIQAGSRVETRVISVSPQSMVIEAMGVEITVPVRDVSNVYVHDLTEDGPYHVGDRVVALITEVQGETADRITAKASIKALEANPQAKEAKRLALMLDSEGAATEVGRIVYIDSMNTFVLVSVHGGATCRCPQPPAGRKALRDDLWSVKITHVDENSGHIDGFLTHFIR